MALSASEHELLSTTCQNMNVAAETCRQVLDMLRNLGNTGVVDIATHNTASTVHAEATNLLHVDNGIAHMGAKGDVPEFPSNYPWSLELLANGGFRATSRVGTKGSTGLQGGSLWETKVSDSNHDLVADSTLGTTYSTSTAAQLIRLVMKHTTSDGSRSSEIWHMFGDAYNAGNFADTSIRFALAKNGTDQAAGYVMSPTSFAPWPFVTPTLGNSNFKFGGLYLTDAANIYSDRRAKENIGDIDAGVVDFIYALNPVQYTMKTSKVSVTETDASGNPVKIKEAPGVRTHWGLIAQDVKTALAESGIEDASVWSLADKDDPDSEQSLRYSELIAPMIKCIQTLNKRIERLERKVM